MSHDWAWSPTSQEDDQDCLSEILLIVIGDRYFESQIILKIIILSDCLDSMFCVCVRHVLSFKPFF